MITSRKVLLLGGTGRTGSRVLTQLLERGVTVTAIVRSAARLPEGASSDPLLTVVECEPQSLGRDDLRRHLDGCNAVISCLGHTNTVRGIFGPPYRLVLPVLSNVVGAIEAMRPAEPVRVVVMTSVSVNRPGKADSIRGAAERAMLWALRGLVPPARDNQRTADFLVTEVGKGSRYVEWVVVRPDTLLDGGVGGYRLSDGLVASLARPDQTNRSNVAHFMCELATGDTVWRRWAGKMPVIVNAESAT